jgi:hypothetical protein
MSEKDEIVERLKEGLACASQLRLSAQSDPKAAAAREKLRAWQSQRLARTHADLLASPRFGPAARFFLTDVYGADHSARYAEVERIVPVMTKLLSVAGLATVADAIELDALSADLDGAVATALGPRFGKVTPATYGQAYRKVGRRPDRQRQIDLVRDLGQSLDRLTHQPFVATTLAMMRKPAKVAGLGELHNFLERGYAAFRQMGSADEFLQRVVAREQELLDALFAGKDALLGAEA